MTKRKIANKIDRLEEEHADGGGWRVIACEHDDGTVTDPDGEPLPDDADPVLTVSYDVARTWP